MTFLAIVLIVVILFGIISFKKGMHKMFQQLIEYFNERNVLILGFGREGRSTYNFIRKHLPEKQIGIADMKQIELDDPNVTLHCGGDYLDAIEKYETVIKTPGISFRDVMVPTETEVTCQTDLFLRFSKCICVGVTGTKGKTTTSTLTYKMLCAGGVDCELMGNMGLPVLDYIEEMNEDKIAVIEMSSHQLEFTRSSPDVSILTNIYEEHLEHYKGGMTGYVNAKLNIVRHQKENDTFIYNGTQGLSPYLDLDIVKSNAVAVKKDDFLPFDIENIHLAGEHNRHDVLYAFAAASQFGVTAENAKKAIDDFEGIEHRMEFVGKLVGIVGTKNGENGNGPWERRVYLVEEVATYPKRIIFEVSDGEVGRYAQWDALVGKNVCVQFAIEASEYNGRWYNNIKAWRIESCDPEPPKNEQHYGI